MLHKYILSFAIVTLFINCKTEDDGKVKGSTTDKSTITLQLEALYNNEIAVVNNLFISEIETLQTVVNAFQKEITETNSIAIQSQWKKVISIWKRLELYAIGPVAKKSFKAQIHDWPANQIRINNFIETTTNINENFIAKQGVNVRGLSAVEVLVFGKTLESYTTGDLAPKQMDYLIAITNDLVTKSKNYVSEWQAYEADFKSNVAQSIQGSQNQLFNAIVFKVEELRKSKLGNPLGIISGNDPNIELTEAFLSEYSLSIIKEEVKGIERLFTGNYQSNSNNLGFYDQLQKLGRDDLVKKIQSQFLVINQKTTAIQPNLERQLQNDVNKVLELFDEINKLVTLIKVDTSSTLNIIVSFNDNDGD